MLARQTGQADEDGLRELQEAQEELHELDVAQASIWPPRANSNSACRNSTEVVSDELVVDFGEKAGGCCEGWAGSEQK